MESDDVLARVEARLARLEGALDRVTALLDQVSPNLAMAADIADDWVARRMGGDAVEARLAALEEAVVRLSDPEVVGALTRLAEKAPKLERVAELAAGFDDHVAMAADIADDWVRENVGGDALEARLQAGSEALVKLSDPKVVGALVRLAEQAPHFESLAGLAASFDDHVAMSADILDAWVRDNIGGDGLEELLAATRGLLDPEVFGAYVDIVRLAPNLMRTARVAADLDVFVDSMAASLREDAAPVGFWGLLTALSDPDVQRGVGRVLHITRHLGRDTNLVPAIRS